MVQLLGRVSFWSYVAALFVLGGFGVLAPRFELARLYDLHLDALEEAPAATVLHQYRFLKAFALGFGAFSFVFRREIFAVRLHNRIFLATLFAAAGARALSLLADGRPHPLLVSFTVSELVFGLLILAATWRRGPAAREG